jgi:hypothetical protein
VPTPINISNINNRRINLTPYNPYDATISNVENEGPLAPESHLHRNTQAPSGLNLPGVLNIEENSKSHGASPSFPIFCVPKTNPHSHINMEMPKYTHELSKQGLRLFIRRFELWAATKRMDDQAAKLAFPLSFQNCTAQQYFLIHDRDLMDSQVSWGVFIQRFLQNCPLEVTEGTSIIKILGKQQQPDEKGSIFVQQIRFLIVTDFPKYDEKEVVSLMMEGLQSELCHYLECRGTPLTYADLVKNIQVYEDRGLQKAFPSKMTSSILNPSPPHQIAPQQTEVVAVPLNIATVRQNQSELEQATQAIIDHLWASLPPPTGQTNLPQERNQRRQSQSNNNMADDPRTGQRNTGNGARGVMCNNCKKPGHLIADCWTRQRNNALRAEGNFNGGGNRSQDVRYDNRDPYHYGRPEDTTAPPVRNKGDDLITNTQIIDLNRDLRITSEDHQHHHMMVRKTSSVAEHDPHGIRCKYSNSHTDPNSSPTITSCGRTFDYTSGNRRNQRDGNCRYGSWVFCN